MDWRGLRVRLYQANGSHSVKPIQIWLGLRTDHCSAVSGVSSVLSRVLTYKILTLLLLSTRIQETRHLPMCMVMSRCRCAKSAQRRHQPLKMRSAYSEMEGDRLAPLDSYSCKPCWCRWPSLSRWWPLVGKHRSLFVADKRVARNISLLLSFGGLFSAPWLLKVIQD